MSEFCLCDQLPRPFYCKQTAFRYEIGWVLVSLWSNWGKWYSRPIWIGRELELHC